MGDPVADKVFAAERTRQAIAAAEAGDIEDARTLLAEALTLDGDYELAWLWFAAITEDKGEQRFCLQRAQKLNPGQVANASLMGLSGVKAVSPPEIRQMIDPPPPAFVKGYATEMRTKRRRRNLKRTVAAIVACAVVIGAVILYANFRKTPVFIAIVAGLHDNGVDTSGEYLAAAQWAVQEWNDSGVDAQHPVELVTYYDNDDPEQAKQVANQIVADGRFIGVIGNELTTTSVAAGPIYAAAGLPAITPAATGDAVTADNDWYFRTVFDNHEQGYGIAAYFATVLEEKKASIVSTDDPYGTSMRQAFLASYKGAGEIQEDIVVSADPAQQQKDLAAAAEKLSTLKDPGPIVLASLDPNSAALSKGLEGMDKPPKIVGTDALATAEFFQSLTSDEVINDSIAATPLTEGSLAGEAVPFYEEFTAKYGYRPSWVAGLTYDAVDAFVESMRRADVSYDKNQLAGDRVKVRDSLAAARTPETSLHVLTGSLYFDDARAAVRPVAFVDGRISPNGNIAVESAAFQLAPYSPTAGITLDEELAEGGAVRFKGQTFTLQRVAAVGYNINQISELDQTTQTFDADFFIWFKYEGKNPAPVDVSFVNAVDPAQGLGPPQRQTSVDRHHYALYRVVGKFKATMVFTAFPFDKQDLPIVIQHKTLPASKMTYVTDPDNLDQPQSERLESGVDAGSTIDQIPNWEADLVTFFPESVGNTSSLGDPYFVAGTTGITYSQMVAQTEVSRDVPSFLVKNLLPLFLLTLVTYVSLWLPFKDATSRISFGVTGILTGAVMLGTVTSSLPQVDYTVAIQWAYYAFIAVSAGCILVTLIGRNLSDQRRLSAVRVLDLSARIAYPVIVGLVAVAYIMLF